MQYTVSKYKSVSHTNYYIYKMLFAGVLGKISGYTRRRVHGESSLESFWQIEESFNPPPIHY